MAALPAVRGLSQELQNNDIDAILANINDDIGKTLGQRFEFVFSPTFLVFDAAGTEVFRGHAVPTLAEVELAIVFAAPDPVE